MQILPNFENRTITEPILCANPQLFQLRFNFQSTCAFIKKMRHSWQTLRGGQGLSFFLADSCHTAQSRC